MKSRLMVLIVILGALIVCYGIIMRGTPAPAPRKPATRAPAEGERHPMLPPELHNPAEYEHVAVEIEIPPKSQLRGQWTRGRGCPHKALMSALGVRTAPSGGIPVFSVEPGKAAAKAGIQVGDRLGEPDDCAKSIYGAFWPRKETRSIEWTVRRPKVKEVASPAGESAPAPEEEDSTSESPPAR
ncbi:MAG: hypothetical protein JSV79_11110 [Armatimonadota bacterium]|nr:MAG: hypothetical protein JSV79_11110 [Armatimonadota bacterium]